MLTTIIAQAKHADDNNTLSYFSKRLYFLTTIATSNRWGGRNNPSAPAISPYPLLWNSTLSQLQETCPIHVSHSCTY